MITKKKNFGLYLDERNIYLLRLCGYIDARTNSVVKGRNLNKLFNIAISDMLLKGKTKEATEKTVAMNYLKYQLKNLQTERDKIERDMSFKADQIRQIKANQIEIIKRNATKE
jgi:hypothetical protein